MLPRTRKSPRTHRACRWDARSRRSCHSRSRRIDGKASGDGMLGLALQVGDRERARPSTRAVVSKRSSRGEFDSDQLGRGGQDDRGNKRDGGEAEGRSTRRGRCGRVGILKTAHRDASGLFQSVQVGSRQGPFPSFCAKLNPVDRHVRTGSDFMVNSRLKMAMRSKPSRGDRRSLIRLEIAVRNDKAVFEAVPGDLKCRRSIQ